MLPSDEAKLSPDYYWSTCPDVEAIVRVVVAKKVKETFVMVPATLSRSGSSSTTASSR